MHQRGYEQKVRLKSLVDNNCDFSALLPLIAPNTNLNLVEVKWVEEAFEPTFIVLEPDFLIPVTTIAKCFVACGASAQYEVVNRLQPSFVNANILLGNFAGQMLDEDCTATNMLMSILSAVFSLKCCTMLHL